MKRHEIVERVNQLMYNELFTYNDIKYELDKAIIEINNILQADYPSMTSVLLTQDSKYFREVVDVEDLPDQPDPRKLYLFEEELFYKPYKSDWVVVPTNFKEIFPFKYIHSVVIPYAVAQLFKRLDEFGSSYTQFLQDFDNGLMMMFRDYHERVPHEYQDTFGGFIPSKVKL